MPQLMADLLAGMLIERSIILMNTATINGCRKARKLLIALTGVSRPQFMKTFQSLLMQEVTCRPHDFLHKVFVAFTGCQQISTATG